MNFCTLPFLVLVTLTYFLYWRMERRNQNRLLVFASTVFYGWWDWRFLGLMFAAAALDFWCGLAMESPDRKLPRKTLLWIALSGNLGMLGFFKYFNFFVASAGELLRALGMHANPATLQLVLPVGISFYTFQTMSYSIDIYRGQLKPTRSFLDFCTFVTFFPQLVAGPIERATNLLPQFELDRIFDMASARDGLRQILWGFVKKIAVADVIEGNTAGFFAEGYPSGGYVMAKSFLFAFQIYFDFSAYSDIAVGCGKLFGIRLMRNFDNPYFSRSFGEFWRRWHISLSTWFRDYVYIPLGGNRLGEGRRMLNVLATFALSGLWHGANWSFVAWGVLNGILVLGFPGNREKERVPARIRDLPKIAFVFVVTCFAWTFFWSASLGDALEHLAHVREWWRFWELFDGLQPYMMMIVPAMLLEWVHRGRPHALDIAHLPMWGRWLAYCWVLWFLFTYGNFEAAGDFIYFQF